jgi:hypothetical protein
VQVINSYWPFFYSGSLFLWFVQLSQTRLLMQNSHRGINQVWKHYAIGIWVKIVLFSFSCYIWRKCLKWTHNRPTVSSAPVFQLRSYWTDFDSSSHCRFCIKHCRDNLIFGYNWPHMNLYVKLKLSIFGSILIHSVEQSCFCRTVADKVVKKFQRFYWSRTFIFDFTRANQWSLCVVGWIQPTNSDS